MKYVYENQDGKQIYGKNVKSVVYEVDKKNRNKVYRKVKKKGFDEKSIITKETTGNQTTYREKPTTGTAAKKAISGTLKAAGSAITKATGAALDIVKKADKAASTDQKRAVQERKNAAHYREMVRRGTLDDGTRLSDEQRRQFIINAKRAEQRSQNYDTANENKHRAITQVRSRVKNVSKRLANESKADLKTAGKSTVAKTISGAVKQSAGATANAAGTLLEGIKHFDMAGSSEHRRAAQERENAAHYREMVRRGTLDDGTRLSDEQRRQFIINAKRAEQRSQTYQASNETKHQPITQVISRTQKKADQLTQSGQQDSETAKTGLGKVGRFAVDAGTAGTQMAVDAAVGLALSPLTGGTSLLAPMAVRSFGGGAQEARQAGKSFGQQLAYGAGSAALAVGTEKMFNNNFLDKKFGGSLLDKVMDKGLSKIGLESAAKSIPGRMVKGALEEGLEEAAEATGQDVALKPLTLGEPITFHGRDTAYQAAIGAALGALGGLGGGVRSRLHPQNPQTRDGTQPVETNPTDPAQPAQLPQAPQTQTDTPVTPKAFADTIQQVSRQPAQNPAQSPTQTLLLPEHTTQPARQAGTLRFMGPPALDLKSDLPLDPTVKAVLDGQKRAKIDWGKIPDRQTDLIFHANDSGLIDMDAENKLFRVDPEQHIDQRSSSAIGSKKLNAFQFDHPQLQRFYKQAAQCLISDLYDTQRGGEIRQYASKDLYTGIGYARSKRITSQPIASLRDDYGMTYPRIEKALNAILNDGGQENYADAKRIELVLDDILSNGYTAIDGSGVLPSFPYRVAKSDILGSQESPSDEIRELAKCNCPFGLSEQEIDDMLTHGYIDDAEESARMQRFLSLLRGESVSENAAQELRQPNDFLTQEIPPLSQSEYRTETQPQTETQIPPGTPSLQSPSGTGSDGLGAANAGFTTSADAMQGKWKDARMADQFPYTDEQARATGLSKEDYHKIFRYQSQTEAKSQYLAEELVYMIKDGQRTFLKDIDENAYQELKDSLKESTAWNGPQQDAAFFIQSELFSRRGTDEVSAEEYTDWLNTMREHQTAGGQGIQAIYKWTRSDNQRGFRSEQKALENLQKSNLTEEQQQIIFNHIKDYHDRIRQTTPDNPEDLRNLQKIILDVAQERGVLTGLFGVTKKQGPLAKFVTEFALNRAFKSLSYDELKQFAFESTAALSTDARPLDWGQAVKTIQVLNMLSNFKTTFRNLGGNAAFYGLDALAMDGSALLDCGLSHFTGTRSIAREKFLASKPVLKSIWDSTTRSVLECALDVDMSGSESRYGTSSKRTFRSSGNFLERLLSTAERNQSYLLNVSDEMFKGAYRASAQQTQKLIDAGKIKTDNTNYATEQAEELAKYRTFQDSTKTAAVIQGLHDVLNLCGRGDSGKTLYGHPVHAFGIGDLTAPFTKVAANLAARVVDYNPVSAVSGTLQMLHLIWKAQNAKAQGKTIDPAQQAKVVSKTVRGLTGSALIGVFYMALKAGLIKRADDEDNEDVAALNRSEGMNGVQINITAFQRWTQGGSTEWQNQDRLVDISALQPFNGFLNVAAEIASDENPTAASIAKDNFMGMLYAAADLPVLESSGNIAEKILKYNQSPLEVIPQQFGSTLISSAIPNLLSGVAKGLDDRPRSTSSRDTLTEILLDDFKSRIPKWRETLPGSVNSMGEEKLYPGDTADRIIDAILTPFSFSTYNQSDVSKEMQRVREATAALNAPSGGKGVTSFYPENKIPKTLRQNQITADLTYPERQDFQRDRGSLLMIHMADMMASDYYKHADPQTQADLLTDVHGFADAVAKKNVLGKESTDSWITEALDAQEKTGLKPADIIRYRDLLARTEKQKENAGEKGAAKQANDLTREAILNDSSLTVEQKNALDDMLINDIRIIPEDKDVDYSDYETYKITQMTDSARKHWPLLRDGFGLDPDTYQEVWSICQNNKLKAAQKRQKLYDMGLNGAGIWKAIRKVID